MTIQVDSREHAKEWERIKEQFDDLGVQYFRSKLYVGDYQSLDNPRLVIDRKKDLQEIYTNICQQHERFKRELLRAIDNKIKIVIVCEHGDDIQQMEDIYFWSQPEMERWHWITREINGKKIKMREKYVQRAINGIQVYHSLCTIRDRYNVDFVFCQKHETGKKIVEILGENHDE